MTSSPLSNRFLEALGHGPGDAESPALDAVLERALSEIRSAHPGLALDEAAFLKHLAERLPVSVEPAEALGSLHAVDLFLAFASLRNLPAAVEELDRRIVTAVQSAVSQFRASPSLRDEVQQLLRQKLLLSTEGAPAKLLDYAGRGPLAIWLRVAAMRVALNLIDAQKPRGQNESSALASLREPARGPESVVEHRRFEPQFKAAMEEALSALTTRERNYLRLYFIEGLTVEAIARMEGAHKSTVSRWLTRSKEALLEDVRRILEKKLALAPQELESLMGDMQSQLDLSLVRILG